MPQFLSLVHFEITFQIWILIKFENEQSLRCQERHFQLHVSVILPYLENPTEHFHVLRIPSSVWTVQYPAPEVTAKLPTTASPSHRFAAEASALRLGGAGAFTLVLNGRNVV